MTKKQLRTFLDAVNENPDLQEDLKKLATARDPDGPENIEELVVRYAAKKGYNFSLPYFKQQLEMVNEMPMGSGDRMLMMLRRLSNIWYLT